MSTSPRQAPAPANEHRYPETSPFPYDIVSPENARSSCVPLASAIESNTLSSAQPRPSPSDLVAQARAAGRQEGLAEASKSFDEKLTHERSSVADALTQFTRDRASYFKKVEGELVQLSLAIARKILHREAQVDPLLLAGIARVALEKIDGATGVVLRLNPQNTADWRAYLSTRLELSDLPEIIEDPAQPTDRCTLETAMGTASIGIEVQLKEIEQGFADLQAARPGGKS